ncbi:MAG: hypothetical protein EOP36_12305 [Rubrivivax sp.]|nr:MAG: hypothetical protein EOP36_12305 [Rubrivivax sp.]
MLATVVVARVAIALVVHSPLSTALAWAALLASLSAGTFCGKAAAARALGWLCIILGVDTLLQLVLADAPVDHVLAAVLWASLALGVGTYVLLSAAVRRFFALDP